MSTVSMWPGSMWSVSCHLPPKSAGSGKTYPGVAGKYRHSPREGPRTEVAPPTFDERGDSSRLEQEEHDDQQTEDDLVEGEHRQHAGSAAAPFHERYVGLLAEVLDHLRKTDHEDRADDRAPDGADTADDDHRHIRDREHQSGRASEIGRV